jgi:hypothetical protein
VPTPSKSSTQIISDSIVDGQQQNQNASFDPTTTTTTTNKTKPLPVKSLSSNNKPLSKLAMYVVHFPLPQTEQFQHERNQRFVVLYGFGSKKQEMLDKSQSLTKSLKSLFCRKMSIDFESSTSNNPNLKKHFNTITTTHFALSQLETERLGQLNEQYAKMSYYDQYAIVNKLIIHLIDIYKSLDSKNYLPKLQYIQFIFDIMESNLNVFNLLLFSIRLLHIGVISYDSSLYFYIFLLIVKDLSIKEGP